MRDCSTLCSNFWKFNNPQGTGSFCLSLDLIAVSIQFEYDPDDLATKNTTQLVHKSNSKTHV